MKIDLSDLTFFLGFSALVSGVAITSVDAAPPPANYVLRTLVKKRTLPKAFKVVTQVNVSNYEGKTLSKWKQTWFYQNGVLRVRAVESVGKVLYTYEWPSGAKLPVGLNLLWPRDEASLLQGLREGGLAIDQPTLVTELRRYGPGQLTIAWVYGKSPELWIEKDAFFAAKWQVQGEGAQKLEWQYQDYRPHREGIFPRKWVFQKANEASQLTDSDHWKMEETVIEMGGAPTPSDLKDFSIQAPGSDAEVARKVYQLF